MVVLDKLGLKITFKLERPPDIPDLLVINMLAQNSGSTILTDFLFQAAVPRVRYKLYVFKDPQDHSYISQANLDAFPTCRHSNYKCYRRRVLSFRRLVK